MGSLSGLFDMTRGALAANQAALDATANNVANQNTAGYTREVASFTAGVVVTLSGSGNGPGVQSSSGPQVATTSARDRVLEARLQQGTQVQAATKARADVWNVIQNVFAVGGGGTAAGSTALGSAINSFFSSLGALVANPSDAATRQGAVSAAGTVASTFRAAVSQLQSAGTGLQGDIRTSLTEVNALTGTVAALNRQIAELSPNADAGTLEDRRQGAIAQLSQLVGLQQIRTENNGITLTTEGGAVLVEGASASALVAQSQNDFTQVLDANGADVTAGVRGGSVGGKLEGQGVDLPAALAALDALAYRIATAVNAQNGAGATASGAAGGLIFSVPAQQTGAAGAMTVVAGPVGIATAAVGEGTAGNGNATALAGLADLADASGETISGGLSSMLAKIGAESSSLNEQATAQGASLTQLLTLRDSVSAVSLDAEAANLSQYQKSYQAAAQLLTVLDRLMVTAINLGTPVAVS